MIKNIVFDMGNVIIRWDPAYIVSQYVNDSDKQAELLEKVYGSQYWLDYDQGTMSRDEVKEAMCQTVSKEDQPLVEKLVHDWHKHCPIILGIEELIKDLKAKGYGIYLLSNTNIHFDEYKDNIAILSYFDGFYISAEHQLVKPDIAIFKDFAKRFNVLLEESIFIDDIQENIDGAIQSGMKGYCFDGNIALLRKKLLSIT